MMTATAAEQQLRCRECNHRLADLRNAITAGRAVVEVKCGKCGESTRITLTPQ
jgi:phage FluMu protein Com